MHGDFLQILENKITVAKFSRCSLRQGLRNPRPDLVFFHETFTEKKDLVDVRSHAFLDNLILKRKIRIQILKGNIDGRKGVKMISWQIRSDACMVILILVSATGCCCNRDGNS